MATLQSPGIQVNVIDESFYTPAAPGTVPLIFVASAANKNNASGTGVAQGTKAENAGKVYLITSQRDLTDTFGTPLFYTDTMGNPIHGGELNEYALQAAYSLLGITSKAYMVRADLDLGQLTPSTDIPTGEPVAGTYWLDTADSLFGIFEWNSSTLKFTKKTPIVIDASNALTSVTSGQPNDSVGQIGDYCIVVDSSTPGALWFKHITNEWIEVSTESGSTFGTTLGKELTISPHYQYPTYSGSTTDGSVWIKTTTPGGGANWVVKFYNSSLQSFTTVKAPIYSSTRQAIEKLDYAGGGANIPVGTLFVESDYDHVGMADFKVWRRTASSPTVVTGTPSVYTTTSSKTFYIRETGQSSSEWSSTFTVTVPGSNTGKAMGALVAAALSAAVDGNNNRLQFVTASYSESTQRLSFSHALGGDFEIKDGSGNPLNTLGFTLTTPKLYAAPAGDTGFTGGFLASNWKPLAYEAIPTTPVTAPADGRMWYDTNLSDVDILVHNGHTWVGYNFHGDNLTTFDSPYYNTGTDPNGPIVSALAPTTQSSGDPLVNGDIWISTDDPELYGKDIYLWSSTSNTWVKQDVTDQNSPEGWVFADARWSNSGDDVEPATIQQLLTSGYLDPDAPDPALYPRGTHLWNTRRSGFNVKKYMVGHVDVNGLNHMYGDEAMTNYNPDRWVTISSNNEDGSGTFGRHAQRKVVTKALKALVDTNIDVRDTDTLIFNLIATPGYPELIANMTALNTDRGQTAFVIGDTPFRLAPNATELNNWGLNKNLAYDNGEDGAITYDTYLGMFYPSGYTTDNTGNNIVVPPSHMVLRTFINNDNVAYPWFAPAGTRRGGIDNATSAGWIESSTGEFKTTAIPENLRNVLYASGVEINPISTIPGAGLTIYGQKTRAKNASALDRINVARLVCFLRYQLKILAKPYLFEPNDALTRREIKAAADSFLLELVGQRALYDFITICDTSNNTNARIDRNELWLDIAIEPVKAVEFIYIPMRILNTGAISSGNLGSLSTGSG